MCSVVKRWAPCVTHQSVAPPTHTVCHTACRLHHLLRHLVMLSIVGAIAAHCAMAVQWCWHATCTQKLISKEQNIVTYLVTEPMLRRKSKWQRAATRKKQVM